MSDEQQGNSPITVDVWSDVMCPFCWMGDRHLELALEEFSHRDDLKITYHSYQLMPDYPENSPLPSAEAVAKQKGMPVEQFKQMNDGVAQRGAEVGLDYNFDQALTVNSRRAHRLSHLAEQQGVQHELMQNLFKAYFTDGKNVEDREVLADLTAEVGLTVTKHWRIWTTKTSTMPFRPISIKLYRLGFKAFHFSYSITSTQCQGRSHSKFSSKRWRRCGAKQIASLNPSGK